MFFDHAWGWNRYGGGGDVISVDLTLQSVADGLGGIDKLIGAPGSFDLHFTDHENVSVFGDVGDNYVYLGGSIGVAQSFIDGGAGYDVVEFGSVFYQDSNLKSIASVISNENGSLTFIISDEYEEVLHSYKDMGLNIWDWGCPDSTDVMFT